jgi:putative chitinase
MTFRFNFTQSHLEQMIKGNSQVSEWYAALCDILPKYNITTAERVVGFVTQCAHESGNFRNLEENLNYSTKALLRVFPRYFAGVNGRNPKDYAGNPEKLANYVYMDEFRSRAGALGNTQPGDGWRFRGRGIKQLTGRNNYAAFGRTVGMTAEQAADYVATKKGALESACWFWDTRNLNRFADQRDITGLSRAINGGNIGLADRIRRWNNGLSVVNSNISAPAAQSFNSSDNPNQAVLKVGSRGPEVVKLQQALGIRADGIFGRGTETALKQWQAGAGLVADGIATNQTLSKIFERR